MSKTTTNSKGKAQTNNKLGKGESLHKKGSYKYRWTDEEGVRHSIYAPSLAELRALEAEVTCDEVDYYEGADYYGLGLKVFTRMAHEAGAVYKIGKMVRIKREIFEEYLRNKEA